MKTLAAVEISPYMGKALGLVLPTTKCTDNKEKKASTTAQAWRQNCEKQS